MAISQILGKWRPNTRSWWGRVVPITLNRMVNMFVIFNFELLEREKSWMTTTNYCKYCWWMDFGCIELSNLHGFGCGYINFHVDRVGFHRISVSLLFKNIVLLTFKLISVGELKLIQSRVFSLLFGKRMIEYV